MTKENYCCIFAVLLTFTATRSLSSLFTKKQDTKMIQNIDNKQDISKHLLDKLSVGAVSGIWFDFYGSKNENRNIVYPKIDENVEFETINGLTLQGEFANKHSVGVFWAKNWGYFYDEQVIRWRYACR